MRISKRANQCCSTKQHRGKRESLPLLMGLFIALIPKCPFCILAYSSAITLCSGTKVYMHHPEWTSWVSIILAIFTLLMVLFNYRGRRTIYAAILVLLGSSLIVVSELYTGEIQVYYYGVTLLLFGVWFNASFLYFYRVWLMPLLHFFRINSNTDQTV